MVGQADSPYRCPLPQGEGTARIAQWKADESGLFSAAGRVHPLPRERAGLRGMNPPHRAAWKPWPRRAANTRVAVWLWDIHDFKLPALPEVADF